MHKRKVQNFLPCKSHPQGRCDLGSGSAGITYDDVLINHHPTRLPPNPHLPPDASTTLTPIELLDVKYGNYIQQHVDPLNRANFALPVSNKDPAVIGNVERGRSQHPHHVNRHQNAQQQQRNGHHRHHNAKKKDHFNPIYEEVSAASDDKIHPNGHSYDSDIEDSEVEGRTVASEDEFAEDELSVAGEYHQSTQEDEENSQPQSATSSLQGSTGGDLYPDVVSGSSERFCSDNSNTDNRALKNNFRGFEHAGLKKHTHSLERNKDGHPSNSFQAKQNYYLNKSMLGPDFTYPEGETENSHFCPSTKADIALSQGTPTTRSMGSSLNFIPVIIQQQQRGPVPSRSIADSPPPPYPSATIPSRTANISGNITGGPNREIISALYNPHIISPTSGRIPEALLRELGFKIPSSQTGSPPVSGPAIGAMSSRSLPVPPSCRAGGSGVLFTVEDSYPVALPTAMSRTRSGSATEFSYHPSYPQQCGRAPTPPPPENIYASIDDDGPFTIDGNRHHRSPFVSGRSKNTEYRNTFGRARSLAPSSKPNSGDTGGSGESHKFHANDVPRYPDDKGGGAGGGGGGGGPYGDIRPIYDSRTACS